TSVAISRPSRAICKASRYRWPLIGFIPRIRSAMVSSPWTLTPAAGVFCALAHKERLGGLIAPSEESGPARAKRGLAQSSRISPQAPRLRAMMASGGGAAPAAISTAIAEAIACAPLEEPQTRLEMWTAADRRPSLKIASQAPGLLE